ncbi:hypothetical protein J2W22_001259 [Sphingomonas kyeonggiensis]|uniref:hypothetical protein n=1 Tax=Sphingomonas kyeonggiensis TaxID=1268553 RepID=UPI0027894806|nr:hypothetical protein [Sphingomonas kyeonggiensis]MDQ0249212.1 hypothetical protein [Sphingomonas kyeonggiensis]
MLGVFDASRGWVPFSSIARAKPSTNQYGTEVADFILTDGTELKNFGPIWEGLWRLPTQLIQAEPGWKLCDIWVEGEPGMRLTPIIAWAYCVDGEIRPVTPCGINDGLADPAMGIFVQRPDGAVESASSWGDGGTFHNPAHLLDHYVAREQARRREAEGAANA